MTTSKVFTRTPQNRNPSGSNLIRILGIDPGYERLGFAVIEKRVPRERVLVSGCFRTSARISFPERLRMIGDEIARLVKEHRPAMLAIEKLYFSTNHKTAMAVAEARGAIIYSAAAAGLAVYEYTPLEIKSSIAGYGQADKAQVAAMVRRLADMEEKKRFDDEYDAIAVALTHSARALYPHVP